MNRVRILRPVLSILLISPLSFGQAPVAPAQPSLTPASSRAWPERCLTRPTGYYLGGFGYWVPPHLYVESPPAVASNPRTHASAPVTTFDDGEGGEESRRENKLEVAIIAALVVVAAMLPFIIYGLDQPATEDVLGRYGCLSAELDLRGGVESDALGGWSAPLYARARLAAQFIGLQATVDVAPWSTERSKVAGSVSLWLRAPPKQNIEIGATIGYRSVTLRNGFINGLELALPHEYVLSRHGASQLGIELRPAVFIYRQGADMQLDVALRIPLGEILGVTLGGRLFTIDAFDGFGGAAQAGVWARW